MSFNFGASNINQFKAQAAYKDGGGMGGGGMYFKQNKKQQDQPEEDIFESKNDSNEQEIVFNDEQIEKDIPQDTLFNQFVNWFRLKHD